MKEAAPNLETSSEMLFSESREALPFVTASGWEQRAAPTPENHFQDTLSPLGVSLLCTMENP